MSRMTSASTPTALMPFTSFVISSLPLNLPPLSTQKVDTSSSLLTVRRLGQPRRRAAGFGRRSLDGRERVPLDLRVLVRLVHRDRAGGRKLPRQRQGFL